MPYPEEMVAPMRAELTDHGFKELKTAEDVQNFVSETTGSALLVINSVCGCAAGSARPGILSSMQSELKPAHTATAFAGNDVDAVNAIRALVPDIPPSSPSAVLLKDGKAVGFVPRHVFESNQAADVTEHLVEQYKKCFA